MTTTGTPTGPGPATAEDAGPAPATEEPRGTAPTQPAATAVSPTARQLWRRARGPLAAAAVLALTGLLIALFTAGDTGTLNPRSATPTGSRALAELLAGHGVDTTLVTTAAEAARATGPGTTLLVAHPEALTPHASRRLAEATARGGRTVLVAPGQQALDALAPTVTAAAPAPTAERAPDCPLDAARRAGTARLGGYRYALSTPPPEGAAACYPVDGLPTLLLLPTGTGGTDPTADTVLLGTPDLLYNDHLDEQGNASLALQLLGAHPHLVWYLPSAEDAPTAEEQRSLFGLLDPGWRWATLQLAIALGLAALWRARRLGPLLTEPLPVLVRAGETTEGRARLYHQAGARDRAAEALRAACRARLAPLLGLPTAPAPEALAAAVAAHTGRPAPEVHALLFGPPPQDDPALVRLAGALDDLERRLSPHENPPPTPHPPRKGEDRSS
ncbi:DUF4350 domain-containing protein [Streptomyces hoynatensis]|uniref:DUF4350 domain-containing protein n=1 Tax=Streptomyces hoynatensis TaxID=1141874 RepID=A0A3A9YX98_9ACTN|nr:DUF4350 domain-containing protein [Streptomyces hoynatensis]RKN39846.1 DUF4350 domain-containing protein [Streptomyces hoynatensis]